MVSVSILCVVLESPHTFNENFHIFNEIISCQRTQIYIYVAANLRNQIFPGIPSLFRESGESLKCIEIPRNL